MLFLSGSIPLFPHRQTGERNSMGSLAEEGLGLLEVGALLEEMERVRQEITAAVERVGGNLRHPEVLCLSGHFDRLHTVYHRLKRARPGGEAPRHLALMSPRK